MAGLKEKVPGTLAEGCMKVRGVPSTTGDDAIQVNVGMVWVTFSFTVGEVVAAKFVSPGNDAVRV
jgi:hypothetical protein